MNGFLALSILRRLGLDRQIQARCVLIDDF